MKSPPRMKSRRVCFWRNTIGDKPKVWYGGRFWNRKGALRENSGYWRRTKAGMTFDLAVDGDSGRRNMR